MRALAVLMLWLAAFVAALLFFIVAVHAAEAPAQRMTEHGCALFAVWARDLAWARDIGADKAKARASIAEMRDAGEVDEPAFFATLLAELDEIWESKMDRADLMRYEYARCLLGDVKPQRPPARREDRT